jgi:hypothetical protein
MLVLYHEVGHVEEFTRLNMAKGREKRIEDGGIRVTFFIGGRVGAHVA